MKAKDGETVVFSFIQWPDKATRDQAWQKVMADEACKQHGGNVFEGNRMFWGGFEQILDTARARRRKLNRAARHRLTASSRGGTK